jgi:hypothetical protein
VWPASPDRPRLLILSVNANAAFWFRSLRQVKPSSIYAPYEPEYFAEAVAAIESVMAEVRKHLKRAFIDQPARDAAALAKSISSKTKRGVGDAKREEVRFLILSGLLTCRGCSARWRFEWHYQPPPQGDTRSNSSLSQFRIGACVPFAFRESTSSDSDNTQPVEKIGGPGWTRTSDQTVMSGRL